MERLSFRGAVQFAWDSTSLTTFKECPRKYYYSILMQRAPREESVHLTFGLHYHAALELYDQLRAGSANLYQQPISKFSHEDALRETVREVMVRTKGWKSDDSYKNRETLIRTVVWYLDQFEDDPAQTIILANGKPAVELSFRFNLPANCKATNEPYIYSGHLDRLVTYMGELYVADRKTTKSAIGSSWFDKFNPHNQMSGYTAAGKIVWHQPVKGVIIDAAQVGVTFSRFARGFTFRSDFQLEEWMDSAIYDIKRAEQCVAEGHWPMNESACDKYGGCPFRQVCAKQSPRQRDLWLGAEFVHRGWDPLQVRGDI